MNEDTNLAEMQELGIEREVIDTVEVPVEAPKEAEVPKAPEPEEPKADEPKQEEVKDHFDPKFKEYKKQLREEMTADFEKKIASLKEELSKAKPSEETADMMEGEIKKLAEELQIDEEKTRRLIEVARKGLGLNAEEKALLDDYNANKGLLATLKEKEEALAEQEIFNTEWRENIPAIKTQYPNATEEQIAQAKEKLDELAHSEKYHDKELDYIIYKEREELGKILFSPKQRTFESGRPTPMNDTDDEYPEFNPNMTPAQFTSFEKRRAVFESGQNEKMRIISRDSAGQPMEIWE